MKLNELETGESTMKTKRSAKPIKVIQEDSKNSEKSSISLNSSRPNSHASKGRFPCILLIH